MILLLGRLSHLVRLRRLQLRQAIEGLVSYCHSIYQYEYCFLYSSEHMVYLTHFSHYLYLYCTLCNYSGFVRFAKPESVKRALKKYREFEIEIQDVSIAIKTLRSERPR